MGVPGRRCPGPGGDPGGDLPAIVTIRLEVHMKTDVAITVQSSNVGLGEALPRHARDAIRRTAAKYFGHLSSASVHFRRDGDGYHCTINIQMGALPNVIGEAAADDCYAAFDSALEHAAKQLRRMKREVRDDKRRRHGASMKVETGAMA